jgi:hypothetical protein
MRRCPEDASHGGDHPSEAVYQRRASLDIALADANVDLRVHKIVKTGMSMFRKA